MSAKYKCFYSKMVRNILGRGHSAPTVIDLIFCESVVLNHFAIKAFCTLRTITGSILHFADNNWIQLLSAKCKMLFTAKWLSTDNNWIQLLSAKCKMLFTAKWLSTAPSHTDAYTHTVPHTHPLKTHIQHPGPPAYLICPGCCPAQFEAGVIRPPRSPN